jgi:hypothetical protein
VRREERSAARSRGVPFRGRRAASTEEILKIDIHLSFKGMDNAQKARLNAYWEKKRAWFKKTLTPCRNGIRDVRLTVRRDHKGAPALVV